MNWAPWSEWHCKLLPLECVKAFVRKKTLHVLCHSNYYQGPGQRQVAWMYHLFFWFPAWLLELVLKIILLRKCLTSLVCLCCAQGFLYGYWTQPPRNSPANFRIHYTVPTFSVQCQWNIPSRLRLLLWCSTITLLFCIEKSAQPVKCM